MPRIRPTEVKAVVKLLDEPAESVETLARQVIEALDDLRAKRREYIVVVDAGGLLSAYGTYGTVKEAQRAVGDPIIASRAGAKGYLIILQRDTTTPVEDWLPVPDPRTWQVESDEDWSLPDEDNAACGKCHMTRLDCGMAGFDFGYYGEDYGWRCENHAP